MRLTTRDVARIRELRYGDGLSSLVVAGMVGCSDRTIRKYAPGSPGRVPNDKLRAAFEASGLAAADVARRLGWDSGHGPDTSRVRRKLGLRTESSGKKGTRYRSRNIDAETVALMAEAIGVAPWEVMPDDDEIAA